MGLDNSSEMKVHLHVCKGYFAVKTVTVFTSEDALYL